jgi:hypothetical protein
MCSIAGEQGTKTFVNQLCLGDARMTLDDLLQKRRVDVERHTNGMHKYMLSICIAFVNAVAPGRRPGAPFRPLVEPG